jgi:predicted anti-sigma-YlaC factor YlaD
MSCTRFRTAISARLDGELPPDPPVGPTRAGAPLDAVTLDAHLATCADCRGFAAEAARVHRVVRLAPAPDVPDLTPGILAAIADERVAAPAPTGASQERALRWILVAIAAVQIAVAVPALLFGADAGLPVHTARHLGSFDIALAVGFLVAAWRPERIPGILPIVAALVVCLVGSSLLDVLSGTTGAGSEAHHATDFAGLVVVWLLSRSDVARPARTITNALRLA